MKKLKLTHEETKQEHGQTSIHGPPSLNDIEPSYMVEFKECSSHYELLDKQNSEQISSDGEFADA